MEWTGQFGPVTLACRLQAKERTRWDEGEIEELNTRQQDEGRTKSVLLFVLLCRLAWLVALEDLSVQASVSLLSALPRRQRWHENRAAKSNRCVYPNPYLSSVCVSGVTGQVMRRSRVTR